MIATPARRQLIVVILLCVAVAGAAMRHFAAPASLTRDIGTLLMLLWLPIIGTIIGWLIARVRRPPPATAPSFATGSAFEPHALVELTLRPSQLPSGNTPVAEGEHRCALVVDDQGYSARWFVPAGEALDRGTPHALEVEFLTPALALPRFPRGAVFRMLIGEAFVADGRVLRLLGDPKAP